MPHTPYPTDLTDAQWARIESLIPVYPGGRPRTTAMRDVVDAIRYIARTGCQWAMISPDVPSRSTVWGYVDEWRHNGTLDRTHDVLREAVRDREKPGHPRCTAGIDSRSVDASSGGEARGRDNAENVDGRKRHIVADSLGLLLAVVVTGATADDRATAPAVLAELAGQPVDGVRTLYADSKYHNHALYDWVGANAGYAVVVVRRPPGSTGRVRLPIRWLVERTFA